MQNYADGASRNRRRIFVGEVLGFDDESGLVIVAVRNRFSLAEPLELLTPADCTPVQPGRMLGPDGNAVDVAPGDGWQVRLPLPWPESRDGLLSAPV